MRLWSSEFAEGEKIPVKYTMEGENLSPPLYWAEAPQNTREFALILEDPDAPYPNPFLHWLIYKIEHHVHELEEGILADNSGTSTNMIEGENSGGIVGYMGPKPPVDHPAHRYIFSLYALDRPLDISVGLLKDELIRSMEGHILEIAQTMGLYQSIEAVQKAEGA